MTLVISPLAEDEVEAMCALAAKVWRQHYPPIIGEAQVEYMLAQRYDPARVREELSKRDSWWDTLHDDEGMVAFANSFSAADAMKLDKLYVHPSRQRMGYGAALVDHTCERARGLGLGAVILAVNKNNLSAINAYRKYGFTIRESVIKDIGGGFVMDDYIMERTL